jgi:nicotinamidase-related amidase
MMANVRSGSKAALLVVDTQVGVMRELWDSPRIIGNLSRAVTRARDNGIPVVWVLHSAKHLPKGSPDWQLVPGLTREEGESVIDKEHNSAFEGTGLEQELARLGVSHIYLGGAATNWCIRATAYAALDRGYDLTLIADAHTTADMETEEGTRIPAQNIAWELNTVIAWLTYPNRRSESAPTADIDFRRPGRS